MGYDNKWLVDNDLEGYSWTTNNRTENQTELLLDTKSEFYRESNVLNKRMPLNIPVHYTNGPHCTLPSALRGSPISCFGCLLYQENHFQMMQAQYTDKKN
jgi:hypothetical protein